MMARVDEVIDVSDLVSSPWSSVGLGVSSLHREASCLMARLCVGAKECSCHPRLPLWYQVVVARSLFESWRLVRHSSIHINDKPI